MNIARKTKINSYKNKTIRCPVEKIIIVVLNDKFIFLSNNQLYNFIKYFIENIMKHIQTREKRNHISTKTFY